MSELTNLIQLIEEKKLTAYKIGKAIGKSEVAIRNILSGKTKRPHKTTLDALIRYVEEYPLNTHLPSDKDFDLDGLNIKLSNTAAIAIENWNEIKRIPAFNNQIELELAKRLLYFQDNPDAYEAWKKGEWHFR